jgi:hypothetical protein
MFKRLGEIEKRIEGIKEVFKEFIGKEPLQIVGMGKNEIYFCLEGFYQEFLGDKMIEVRIREIQEFKSKNFNLYETQDYLKIEQITKYDDRNYLIIFEMYKFEKK